MPELPPVIQLLATEDLRLLSDPTQSLAILRKGLHSEMKRQARWTLENFEYAQSQPSSTTHFVATPSQAVNPLATGVGCDQLRCRLARARTFTRTIGLWADEIYMPDVFSAQIGNAGRLSSGWASVFSREVAVLGEILPLVQRGIIRFRSPKVIVCRNCTDAAISNAMAALVEDFASAFEFSETSEPGWISLRSALISDALIHEFRISEADREAAAELVAKRKRSRLSRAAAQLRQALVTNFLSKTIKSLFLDLHEARELSSVVVSGTRMDLLCLRRLEREVPAFAAVEEWEQPREVHLPWVSNLSVENVIRLREQAATALPRLRAMIGSSMISGEGSRTAVDKVISELRSQAAEVEAELVALRSEARRRDKTAIALLSAGIALYGFGVADTSGLAAAGQLLTTLGMIHGFSRNDHSEETKLKSRPGYVLVKARQLLAAQGHAPHAG